MEVISASTVKADLYRLCSILDGFSRYVVNWHPWESMTGADIGVILERTKQLHPKERPRIISINGSEFHAFHKSYCGNPTFLRKASTRGSARTNANSGAVNVKPIRTGPTPAQLSNWSIVRSLSFNPA